MLCPSLNELPLPPQGKTGWPWTAESMQLPDKMPDGKPWPRISIVSPSFNQGQFIEETIRSVLLQGYPDLEYIIMDGGSDDDSVEIIKKYETWLKYWVSELDEGQSDAINRGFGISTGPVMAWINSDDLYERNALAYVAERVCIDRRQFLIGLVSFFEMSNKEVSKITDRRNSELMRILTVKTVHQVPVFWTRRLWNQVDGLDTNLNFALDVDLFIRMLYKNPEIVPLEKLIGFARTHSEQKIRSENRREISQEAKLVRRRIIRGDRHLAFRILFYLLKRRFSLISRRLLKSEGSLINSIFLSANEMRAFSNAMYTVTVGLVKSFLNKI